MKKVILILTCFISMIVLCGCAIIKEKTYQDFTESDTQYINRTGVNDNRLVCIDGIEYIMFGLGNRGFMSPHLKADKFDNPKVIRCQR